jgi:hypothetical protein
MWPFFTPTPAGFSDVSLTEFSAHQKQGGAECFLLAEESVNSSAVLIEPGKSVAFRVVEGETINLQFGTPRGNFADYFSLHGQPEGSVFDPSTGSFHYQPTKAVVSARAAVLSFGCKYRLSEHRLKQLK